MTLRWRRVALTIGIVAGLGVLTGVALLPLVPVEPDGVTEVGTPLEAPKDTASAMYAAALASHDPFRIARRPAAVRYSPPAPPKAPRPPVPKPQLTLTGVASLSDRDRSALIEGFPGLSAPRGVREGDVIGGIRVVQIGADSVVLAGFDTLWALHVTRFIP